MVGVRVADGVFTFAEVIYRLQVVMAGVARTRFGEGHLFATVVLMLLQRLMLRGHFTGQQRRQYPCRHGGAGKSPKDQDHHHEEIEAATHR